MIRLVQRRGIRLASLLCLLPIAGTAPTPGASRPETKLLVSVAVSLRPAIAEIAASFDQAEVLLNAGGSGVLAQQARRGAAVDLFISASPVELDRLESDELLQPGSRRAIASNRLVVLVPHGEPLPAGVDELTRFDSIAVGNPRTAPVGRYAEQALRSFGLYERLSERLVFAENARQVLDYVARGEVEAGLAYRSDAALVPGRVDIGPQLPADSHSPILYQAAVLADAPNPGLAAALLNRLRSRPAQQTLERHGFLPAR